MPEFKTITIGQSAEENIMFKPQEPAGFVDEFDLDQITGNGLYATLWRHGGDSPTGEKRIALFRDPSEELEFLRGRVTMLEKYETEFLRLIREAEAERDLLKDQNTTFSKLLTTSCQFLYASCLTEEIAHADEILAVLKAARAEAVGTDISDSKAILDYLASKIVGKTISVDMSTGDDDVGNRIFCTVAELMREGDSFTILAEDPKPNYADHEATLVSREVEQLHASAETVNEVLVRCRQERTALRAKVAMALSLAQAGEQNEPHAGFGTIVDALSSEDPSANPEAQAEKGLPTNLLALQCGLLDWNRALPKPIITPGYEYGVAAAISELLQRARSDSRLVGTSAQGAASDLPAE